jgi:hypothetical protein
MPISKEENEVHRALIKSQKEISKNIKEINKKIKNHYKKHGVHGIGFIDDLKSIGNTIKSGFEDKIEHPLEDFGNTIKSGFQNDIIDPVQNKIINPTQNLIDSLPDKTKQLFNSIPESMRNDPKFQKALDYVTKKKGGLASSLLHNGLPSLTSALGGAAGTILAPELGMFGGIAGSTAGGYAGKELADYIGNKTGTGLRRKMKGKGYADNGFATQSDIDSYADSVNRNYEQRKKEAEDRYNGNGIKKRGRPKKISPHHIHHSWESEDVRPRNSALGQLIEAHRASEAKELHKGQLDITRHLHQEMMALRNGHPLRRVGHGIHSDSDDNSVSSDDDVSCRQKGKKSGMGISNVSERKFKKGSKEAKEHMARIRAMKGINKVKGKGMGNKSGAKFSQSVMDYNKKGGKGLYP